MSWYTLSLRNALLAFRSVYVAFLVSASAMTLASGLHGTLHEPNSIVLPIAVAEIGGALLFLFRSTERIGGVILLIVFAAATALSVAIGDLSLRFVYYATTTLFILFISQRSTRRFAEYERD